jgi:hypothetical protein
MVSLPSNLRTIANEDGAAILDIDHDSISTLNPTGAYVWQGLQQAESVETIVAKLTRETGEDPLVVDRDVRAFIEELKKKQLLSR